MRPCAQHASRILTTVTAILRAALYRSIVRIKRVGPRRRERADQTRERLFAAAIALFTKQGYQATSVERICVEAGVAKGTFFVHFDSKAAVLVEVVRSHARAATAARTRVRQDGGSAVDGMREAMMAL